MLTFVKFSTHSDYYAMKTQEKGMVKNVNNTYITDGIRLLYLLYYVTLQENVIIPV